MRFLLLNQFYPPDVAPTGQVLHDLACELSRGGHQVRVYSSRRSYDGGARFPSQETIDGVEVRRIAAFGFGRATFLGKLCDYASFYSLLCLRLIFTRFQPDLIVSLTTPPYLGLLARLAAKRHHVPHLHWIMDLYPDVMVAHGMVRQGSLTYRFLRRLTRWQLKDANRIIALGPDMAARIKDYAGESAEDRVVWAPLWSALEPWPEDQPNGLRKQRGWGPDDLVLMYSGNMGVGHRFGEFLATANRLGANGPLWAFGGGGKRRAEIEQFARAHPAARIQMLPYVAEDQLRESLCSADVHLVSFDSAWQGLMVPSKLQAIFAVGKPVIFVGGETNELARWVRESGGGWIVAENDLEGLLKAIDQARCPDERRTRGQAARRFAEEHFNLERNCGRLADMIEEALSKDPRPLRTSDDRSRTRQSPTDGE